MSKILPYNISLLQSFSEYDKNGRPFDPRVCAALGCCTCKQNLVENIGPIKVYACTSNSILGGHYFVPRKVRATSGANYVLLMSIGGRREGTVWANPCNKNDT